MRDDQRSQGQVVLDHSLCPTAWHARKAVMEVSCRCSWIQCWAPREVDQSAEERSLPAINTYPTLRWGKMPIDALRSSTDTEEPWAKPSRSLTSRCRLRTLGDLRPIKPRLSLEGWMSTIISHDIATLVITLPRAASTATLLAHGLVKLLWLPLRSGIVLRNASETSWRTDVDDAVWQLTLCCQSRALYDGCLFPQS